MRDMAAPTPPALEARLDRLGEELAAVIQALRLMSDMQRQQGEQLSLILQLLTAPPEAGSGLSDLLRQLLASNTALVGQVMQLASATRQASDALPAQLAQSLALALSEALREVGSEAGGGRR